MKKGRSVAAPALQLSDIIQSRERKLFRGPLRGSLMYTPGVNDVYGIDELEATGSAVVQAHEHGHDLGDRRLLGERMRASGCRLCGRLVWIVRPPGEETWRVGGNALNADCEGGFR